MLDERLARERPEVIRAGLRRRHAGAPAEVALDAWLALDARRRAQAGERDRLAVAVAAGTAERRALDAAQRAVVEIERAARTIWLALPNLPDPRVPEGQDERGNVELRRWGEPPSFTFAPRPHWELGAALGVLDAARAAQLAGPRFPLLVGAGARLVRALAALMLDLHVRRGYVEVAPPHLLRPETLEATGHLPRYADDLFAVPGDRLYLSPTAEAQLVGLHAGELLSGEQLPLAYTACTPAFRREAGSAGRATRGLLRQHQFDKVELVRIATPEGAEAAFDTIVADAEAVLQRLELAYRVVALSAGELPFNAQRTHDLEVWMPSQEKYVEISSVSDCGTFQARRAKLRFRPAGGGRPRLPHTLNGSALAIGRTVAALLENGQQPDESVRLPGALAAYAGFAVLGPPAGGKRT
jgi:seryl-tRNA synthetase